MLDNNKTEFIVVETRQILQRSTFTPGALAAAVLPSSEVRNLGYWFDHRLKRVKHINKMFKTALFHIFNIRRINKFLGRDTV